MACCFLLVQLSSGKLVGKLFTNVVPSVDLSTDNAKECFNFLTGQIDLVVFYQSSLKK